MISINPKSWTNPHTKNQTLWSFLAENHKANKVNTASQSEIPTSNAGLARTASEKLVIIVWANEIYDPKNPDTIQHRVSLWKK